MKTNKPGFVLLGVFLMLTMATIIVTQVYYKGTLYNSFVPVALKREQAKQLAQSGITIAINQLALHDYTITPPETSDNKKQQKEPNDPERRAKQLMKLLLTVQNRWQTFEFEKDQDGFEGELSICITCEEGKIPLGALIDKKTGKIKTEAIKHVKTKLFLQDFFVSLKPFIEGQDLFESLQTYLKKQEFNLVDITDILISEQFKKFQDQIFFEPQEKRKDVQLPEKVYWADLFTLWHEEPRINPLLLSPSLRVVMKMGTQLEKKQLPSDQIDEIVKKIPVKEVHWQSEWDKVLQPVYGRDYKGLSKEFTALLSSKFEPRVFSVLCYGKVGQIGQKLLAIVAREFTQQGEVFEVKKLYWL
jgi:hypothetical protein